MNRHAAKIVNTDQRCLVIYKQIPDRATHALVVATDSLPLRLESTLTSLVESSEGQSETELSHLLGRRLLPETGTTVLQTLHEHGLLHSVPIDNLVMMPVPNMPIPLRQVIEKLGGLVPPADPSAEDQALAEKTARAREQYLDEQMAKDQSSKFNPYADATAINVNDNQKAIAQGLLIEAQMLESDAQRKRDQAYVHNPALRPSMLPPETTAQADAPAPKIAPAKKPRAKAKTTKA